MPVDPAHPALAPGLVALAYLLGCIPTGVIVGRAHGVDLRVQGSGNIGATNALRVIGRKAGIITLIGDMLKGAVAVSVAAYFAGGEAGLYAAAAAVVGHDFPVFSGFRGGKGVATSYGVLLGVTPPLALAAMALWVGTVAVWRISSLGALVSFAALPVLVFVARGGVTGVFLLALFLSSLIYIKHAANISRLLKGAEPRLGGKA